MLDMLKHISDLTILNFMSVFEALNVISRTIEGRKRKGRLVYAMTMFFSKSLDLLHTLGGMQLEHEEAIENQDPRRKACVEEAEYVADKHLERILSTIVYNLGWKQNQAVHSELLEGILYVVLDHTGRMLSMTVFRENVAASKNPGNITETDGDAIPNKLSKHEMRYAVQVLHNALGGRDKKDLFLHVLASGKRNLPTQVRMGGSGTISVPHGDLLKKAKILLQSTLVKTTLGHDELETLISPSMAEEVSDSVVDGVENIIHGPLWFVEQMWSLIGWDLVV